MKKLYLLLILIFCLAFPACGGNTNSHSDTEESHAPDNAITSNAADSHSQQGDATSDSAPIFFESDEVVNDFFTTYNTIAEVEIPVEEIEEGNIKTKALVYIDDLSLEIINANDYLSVSMSSSVDNEDTKLYAVFRDIIKTMNADTTDDDIQSTWNAIHESGFLVEGYDFNGISITYMPSKELSWGTSDLRVDLAFPLS